MSFAAEVRGAGRPIVCLPMFSLAASVTAAALEPAFAGRPGRQRHYVDPPGHGAAPPGPETADEIVELLARRIELDRFRIAGFSYGGYLAAALARRYPRRVAGLLLVCHAVRVGREDRDLPADERAPAAAGWLDGVGPELAGHLAVALGRRTPEVAARVVAVVGPGLPRETEYLERLRAKGYRLSDEDSEATFAGPTTIIAGRCDLIGGYADQVRALERYPRGGLHGGRGHRPLSAGRTAGTVRRAGRRLAGQVRAGPRSETGPSLSIPCGRALCRRAARCQARTTARSASSLACCGQVTRLGEKRSPAAAIAARSPASSVVASCA
ncbi:alpha/beta fold hydrolase [Actinoplanes nipponensis]|uniref:alpha/beta fold hydrolase n=1 Tax=Actinoplanes nipponensis TaxID=135950 RepID=UPI001EF3A304|nr:alpha/beta hydrolase [Actinoplanes nipponensis]